MPPSELKPHPAQPAGQTLAVTAEALYLLNLLLIPGIAFIILLLIYLKTIRTAPPLAVCHLRQTISASLWAGLILVVINVVIISVGGYTSSWTWVIVILYFTICHATLILLGTVGLARAMNGKAYRFPVVGRPCDGVS
jgi:uncharacterized Tic20 family protein